MTSENLLQIVKSHGKRIDDMETFVVDLQMKVERKKQRQQGQAQKHPVSTRILRSATQHQQLAIEKSRKLTTKELAEERRNQKRRPIMLR